MVFRRIYWVTEQIDNNGKSQVTGVYTSIHDLVGNGLRWIDGEPAEFATFRLSLVKLDYSGGVLGCWESPNFDTLAADLQPFVATQEFTIEDVTQLPLLLGEFINQGR
ncbi:MAG: hypothetical protein KF784_13395 [Fimbriimonadaceae bacterium]|nr:hypothetical protein [Fimbriimonadaceae bacterium]